MTIGRFDAPRDRPFFWWGARERTERVPELAELVGRGAIDIAQAAFLLLLVDRGVSMFSISEASGAGKSTLLASLIETSTSHRKRIYLRGNYETFDFLDTTDPVQTVLLLNEISPHLPAYLWGPGVHRVMECMRSGYQVLGTAHAASGPAFIHLLTSPPLRVPFDAAIQACAIVRLAEPGQLRTGPLHIESIGGIIPGVEAGAFRFDAVEGSEPEPFLDLARRLLEAANLDSTGLSESFGIIRSGLETDSVEPSR